MWFLGIVALVITLVSNTLFLLMGVPDALKPLGALHQSEDHVVPKEQTKFFTFRSREIETLITELEHQKNQIAKKKDEIIKIEEVVAAEKKELEQSRRELEALREKVYSTITSIAKTEKKNLKELAVTYANMPPATIVEVFNEMDDVFVVKILTFMESDTLAPIFQAMVANASEPEFATKRVVRLTKLLRMKGDAFE